MRITKKAKAMGLIPMPKKCNRCGQDKGILHSHNEDYDFTLNILPKYMTGEKLLDDVARDKVENCLEPICWTCHMIHHKKHRNKEAHDEYFRRVYEEGFVPPPVFKHNWAILKQYGF
jgi:hypothetical protein